MEKNEAQELIDQVLEEEAARQALLDLNAGKASDKAITQAAERFKKARTQVQEIAAGEIIPPNPPPEA